MLVKFFVPTILFVLLASVCAQDASAMYNARVGSFCSRDPIGYADGPNSYRAHFGLSGKDPSGMRLFIDEQEMSVAGLIKWGGRVGYAGNHDGTGVAEPYTNAFEFDVIAESPDGVCAGVLAAKPVHVDVLHVVANDYVSSGVATVDGETAIIAHEQRRVDVYQKGYDAYLAPLEEPGDCGVVCHCEEPGLASLLMQQYLDDRRKDAMDAFNAYVLAQQTAIGGEQTTGIAPATGTFAESVGGVTITGYRPDTLHTPTEPPAIPETPCP